MRGISPTCTSCSPLSSYGIVTDPLLQTSGRAPSVPPAPPGSCADPVPTMQSPCGCIHVRRIRAHHGAPPKAHVNIDLSIVPSRIFEAKSREPLLRHCTHERKWTTGLPPLKVFRLWHSVICHTIEHALDRGCCAALQVHLGPPSRVSDSLSPPISSHLQSRPIDQSYDFLRTECVSEGKTARTVLC